MLLSGYQLPRGAFATGEVTPMNLNEKSLVQRLQHAVGTPQNFDKNKISTMEIDGASAYSEASDEFSRGR